MIDMELLDRMNFGQLGETLDSVIEMMKRLANEGSDDEDDSRRDMLLVVANQIVERMDSIMRDYGADNPEVLDTWNQVAESYKDDFKKYVRTYLKDGVPLLTVEPDDSSQASRADASVDADRQTKLDGIVLDETLLDGMSAGELFQVNQLITEKVEQLDEEFPEDLAKPLINKLLKFGDGVIRRLDPLMRERYRDNPETLAQWEAIMNDYEALDDEDDETPQADIESSEIS